jgi:hypothetical protein
MNNTQIKSAKFFRMSTARIVMILLLFFLLALKNEAQLRISPDHGIEDDGYFILDSVSIFSNDTFVGMIAPRNSLIGPSHLIGLGRDRVFVIFFAGIAINSTLENFVMNIEIFRVTQSKLNLESVHRCSLGKYHRNCTLFEISIVNSIMSIWIDIGNGQSKGINFNLKYYESGDFDILFKNIRQLIRSNPKVHQTTRKATIEDV